MNSRRIVKRPLNIDEIWGWAVAYREATGKCPTKASGGIASAPFETWLAVDAALREGLRGLPGGISLAQLLAEKLGVRNVQNLPDLPEETILLWMDEHLGAVNGPVFLRAASIRAALSTVIEKLAALHEIILEAEDVQALVRLGYHVRR